MLWRGRPGQGGQDRWRRAPQAAWSDWTSSADRVREDQLDAFERRRQLAHLRSRSCPSTPSPLWWVTPQLVARRTSRSRAPGKAKRPPSWLCSDSSRFEGVEVERFPGALKACPWRVGVLGGCIPLAEWRRLLGARSRPRTQPWGATESRSACTVTGLRCPKIPLAGWRALAARTLPKLPTGTMCARNTWRLVPSLRRVKEARLVLKGSSRSATRGARLAT